MELTIFLSILASVISVSSFVIARKDKSNKDIGEDKYRQGILDNQLKNIMEKLDKIDAKLDSYDKEIDEKIDKAITQHISIYHKGE